MPQDAPYPDADPGHDVEKLILTAFLFSTCGGRLRGGWWIVGVVAVGLTVRLIHLDHSAEIPYVRHLVGDASGYYEWARDIEGGRWLGDEAFYQAPLYPYVLAMSFRLFGHDIATIRLLQALGGALAVGCLAWAVCLMFDRPAGTVAGLMLALYGPAIFFDGIVQKASLGCLLLCGLLLAVSLAQRSRGLVAAGVVGVLTGLLVLTRENAIVWLACFAVWFWLLRREADWRRRVAVVALYAAGVALVLLPVGVRNAAVSGAWSVSTFQAGPNFYIGNSRDADGRYRPLIRGHETPAFERRDATELAERALGRNLSAREVSRYWMSRATQDVRAEPLRWLRLMGLKMLMVWNAYEVSDVESLYVYAEYSPVLRWLGSVWHFGVLCPAAVAGVILTRREGRRLWIYYVLIVAMACAVACFYVLARYRFPLVPLLIPFAAAGCVEVVRRLRSGRIRGLSAPVLAALAVAVVVNRPVHDERRLGAMAYSNLGSVLGAEGDLSGATRYLRLAIAGHPESAEAHFNLAYALSLQRRKREAVTHYRAALALEPTLIHADRLLASALEALGEIGEAVKHYRRALELDPSNSDARAALARLRKR